MVEDEQRTKHGQDKYVGPYTITEVKDNGAVTLRKDGNAGAVTETWSVRNIEPCAA